jgi:hypothetical protein
MSRERVDARAEAAGELELRAVDRRGQRNVVQRREQRVEFLGHGRWRRHRPPVNALSAMPSMCTDWIGMKGPPMPPDACCSSPFGSTPTWRRRSADRRSARRPVIDSDEQCGLLAAHPRDAFGLLGKNAEAPAGSEAGVAACAAGWNRTPANCVTAFVEKARLGRLPRARLRLDICLRHRPALRDAGSRMEAAGGRLLGIGASTPPVARAPAPRPRNIAVPPAAGLRTSRASPPDLIPRRCRDAERRVDGLLAAEQPGDGFLFAPSSSAVALNLSSAVTSAPFNSS